MSSQSEPTSQCSIDPALLERNIIIVDMPPDTPMTDAPSSSPPSSAASAIETVSRRRFAWVWKHMPDANPQTIYKDDKGRIQWRCQHCSRVYLESGGTRIIASHLKRNHRISENTIREERKLRVQSSIEQAMENARQSSGFKRRRGEYNPFDLDDDNASDPIVDPHIVELLLVQWFARCNVSLNMIECDEFRAILTYLNKDTEIWLPACRKTADMWVHRTKEEQIDRIVTEIANARSKIHVWSDIWTSNARVSVVCGGISFLGFNGKMKTILVGIRELRGSHAGVDVAPIILEIIEQFSFQHNLGYFIMDNASSNDTMMVELAHLLEEKHGVFLDPIAQRIRCTGHIFSLSGKDFMFTSDEDTLAEENNEPARQRGVALADKKAMEKWRKSGAPGKCHDFSVSISMSPERLQRWLKICGLRLPRDNSTRWGSWEHMIGCFIKLRWAYEKWWIRYPAEFPESIKLTATEWDQLEKLHGFLKALNDAIKFLEGPQATLERVLPTMEFILEHFEQGKIKHADDPFLGPCCNAGWAKLNKYYTLTEKSPAYVAAVVLDPSQKWTYFEEQWTGNQAYWVTEWRQKIQLFWEIHYKGKETETDFDPSNLSDNLYVAYLQSKKLNKSAKDEYARYLSLPPVDDVRDPRSWWLEATQQAQFPYLSKMAIDMLTIPSMSADAERIFSGCKLQWTDRRNRLSVKTLESLECLKSWMNLDNWEDNNSEHVLDDDVEEAIPVIGLNRWAA